MKTKSRFKPLLYAGMLFAFTFSVGALLTIPFASAGSEPFNFVLGVNAVCTLSSSTGQVYTKTISPGTHNTIGTSKIKALCNDPGGFSIYAVGFSGENYGDNYLHPTNISDIYKISTGTTTSGDTSAWSMTIANDNTVAENNALVFTDEFLSSHRVPETFTKIAYRSAKTDATTGANFKATFSAYISPTQATDTYEGSVKFTLVHPSTAVVSEDDSYPVTLTAFFLRTDPTSTSALSTTHISCVKQSADSLCEVTLPTFSVGNGWENMGWGLASDGSGTHYAGGTTVELSRNTTFYTLAAHHHTATFVNQHTDYYSTSENSKTCYAYNGSEACIVETPVATKISSGDDYFFRGWNSSSTATTPIPRSDTVLTISNDGTYYSVIGEPVGSYSINFADGSYSGMTSIVSIDEATKSCYIYPGEDSCIVTAPGFTAAEGYVAYGYDIAKYNELKDTTVEIGDNITITSANNGRTYYTVARSRTKETVEFINQHENYLTASSSEESCYTYNGYYYCKVYAPTLTNVDPNSTGVALGWSTNKNSTTASVQEGGVIYAPKGSPQTYYSVASGFAYVITFSKNVSFEGSDPTGTNWRKWSNIEADSLSFYTETCTVRDGGCYLTEIPRIYSEGNTPGGFSLTQYGDAVIDFLLDHNFTADTTVYARVFNWGVLDYDVGIVDKIYLPGSSTEYYEIDYESTVNVNLAHEYTQFIETVFQNAPQLFVLHGKMRFYTMADYNERHGSGSQMLTGPNTQGMFSPIEVKPTSDTAALSTYAKAAAVHEMGHALDHYYLEVTGLTLSRQAQIAPLFQQYKADYDAYIAQHGTFVLNDGVPLRAYSYTNMNEFIADCFTDWYQKRTGHFTDAQHGQTTAEIDAALDYYLCQGEYATTLVCTGV